MTKYDFAVFAFLKAAENLNMSGGRVNDILKYYIEKNIDAADIFDRKIMYDDFPEKEIAEEACKNRALYMDMADRLLRRKIDITARGSVFYPQNIEKKLGRKAPPIFYSIGNKDIATERAISVVGGRKVPDMAIEYAEKLGALCAASGFVLVSGGADGVDSAAQETALARGGKVVAYIAEGFEHSRFVKRNKAYIEGGTLLCMCSCDADKGFNGRYALMRNRYIHSHGELAVAVYAKYKSGGSWAGSLENLESGFSPLAVSSLPAPGNEALAEMGAYVLGFDEIARKDFDLAEKIKQIVK